MMTTSNRKKIVLLFWPDFPNGNASNQVLLDQAVDLFEPSHRPFTALYVENSSDPASLKALPELLDAASCRFCKSSLVHAVQGKVWTLEEIYKEAKYSDMLVVSHDHFKTLVHGKERLDTLKMPCPILILQSNAEQINNVVILFDSARPGLKHVKEFCYTLQQFSGNFQVNLLLANNTEEDWAQREEQLLIDYLKCHFSNLGILKLNIQDLPKVRRILEIDKSSLVVLNSSHISDSGDEGEDIRQIRKELLKNAEATVFIGSDQRDDSPFDGPLQDSVVRRS